MRIDIRSIAKGLLAALLIGGLAACGGINKPFNPMEDKHSFKNTSIAVLAGDPHDSSVRLADEVTKGLAKRSSYRVMSQEDIAKVLPNYPFTIAAKELKEIKPDDDKVVWFTPAEKAHLASIQAKLKVDNLFVIWNSGITLITSDNGSTYVVYPIGNMIEYPGGKVVASTRSANGSSTSILALFRSKDYYIVDALNGAAENIVDDFLDVTKAKK